jgi:hypothetical protein
MSLWVVVGRCQTDRQQWLEGEGMDSNNGPVEDGGERDVKARLLLLLLGLLLLLLLRRGFVFVVFLVL